MNRAILQKSALGLFCVCVLLGIGMAQAQSADFVQLYTRGKLLLKQKLYLDGIKELKRASYTTQGQQHFGVNYYLAVAYFKLSSIQQAGTYLKKAEQYAKNRKQKEAATNLGRRLKTLYGRLQIMPQVDPDDVGRLKLELSPKAAFSNKYKAKFFERLAKQLRDPGVVPNNKLIYLPKGDYTLSISRPQCLKYGLFKGNEAANELSVGESTVQLALQEKSSCRCEGGQKLFRKGKQLLCDCPTGTGWNKKTKRCETGKVPVAMIAGITTGAVVLTAGIVIAIAAVVANNTNDDFTPILPEGTGALWKPAPKK